MYLIQYRVHFIFLAYLNSDMKKIISNLITPFNSDLEVDYDNLNKIIEMNERNSIDELSLFSLTSETLNLNEIEKRNIYNYVKENSKLNRVINIYSSDINEVIDKTKTYNVDDTIYLHKPYLYEVKREDILVFYESIIVRLSSYKFYLECDGLIRKDLLRLIKHNNVKGIVLKDVYYATKENELFDKVIIENDNNITNHVFDGYDKYISNIAFAFGNIINEIIEDSKIRFKNILLYSYLDLVNEVFNELPLPINVKYYLSLKGIERMMNYKIPISFDNNTYNHFDLLI